MSENEHLENHEETQPIASDDTNVQDVEKVDSSEIDVEQLKRELTSDIQRWLTADINTFNYHSYENYYPISNSNIEKFGLKECLFGYLKYISFKIRKCGQRSESINYYLRDLLDTRSDLLKFFKFSQALHDPNWLVPNYPRLKNKSDREVVRELITFAYDYLKKYSDYILSLPKPKPALGSDNELLRPANSTGEVDTDKLVRPVYPEDKASDDVK